MCNKGLMSKIYKKLLKHNRRKKQPDKNMVEIF